jgi:hypothetical protein
MNAEEIKDKLNRKLGAEAVDLIDALIRARIAEAERSILAHARAT